MISATSSTPAPASSGPSSAANKPATEKADLETFLKMLTTQIKNQDPLNPMEGSDFALQLATFSGVEQQVRSNQLLEAMAGGGAAGLAQYASWIGKEARSTAPATFSGAPIALDVSADAAADRIVLVARDSYGRIASHTENGTRQRAGGLGGAGCLWGETASWSLHVRGRKLEGRDETVHYTG